MKRKHRKSSPSHDVEEDGEEGGSGTDKLSKVVKLGDLVWVKLDGSSWWPAQVVDANTVSESSKPSNRSVGEVLVRIYGSYTYLFVDPTKSRLEFENILKLNNGSSSKIFQKSLEEVSSYTETDSSKGQEYKYKGKVRVEADTDKELKKNLMDEKQEEKSSESVKVSPRRRLVADSPRSTKKNGLLHSIVTENAKVSSKKMEPNTPDLATKSARISEELSARRKKVMQSLGLVAPSGSPFNRVEHI